MAQTIRVVHVGDGFAAGEVANVCVVVWRGPVTRARFDTQREALSEVIGRHPEGAGFLCVIEPTASPPDDELRRASAKMIADHQAGLRCIACVVEGSGLANAIARSALSAMALLLGARKTPFSVFGSVSAAATWMVPHLDVRDVVTIARTVDRVRGELEPWVKGKGR